MKYRPKTVVDAVRFTLDSNICEILELVGAVECNLKICPTKLSLITEGGTKIDITSHEYVVKDSEGLISVYSNSSFLELYEKVED